MMKVFYKLEYINTVLILKALELAREVHRHDPDFDKLPDSVKRAVTTNTDMIISDMKNVLSQFDDQKNFQEELQRIIKNN